MINCNGYIVCLFISDSFSLLSYFHFPISQSTDFLFRFVSFRFVFRFVSFRFVSFRFVCFVSFHKVQKAESVLIKSFSFSLAI